MRPQQPIHPLFGGYMEGCVPERMVDVSAVRNVPDSMEMFACVDEGEFLGQTLCVELVQQVPGGVLEALQANYDDLVAGVGGSRLKLSSHVVLRKERIQLPSLEERCGPGAEAACLSARQEFSVKCARVEGSPAGDGDGEPTKSEPPLVEEAPLQSPGEVKTVRTDVDTFTLVILRAPKGRTDILVYSCSPSSAADEGIALRLAETLKVRDWLLFEPE